MVLPTFLGIGAPKCGSTWIHELLQQHPDVYMPTKRKEINYFNLEENYQKGLGWYESFFPSVEEAKSYQTIGEFTPRYLYQPEKCARRISNLNTVEKIIIILRNPTKRSYSQYCHALRAGHNRGSFSDFLEDKPRIVKHGFYAKNLQPFFDRFDRDKICCFIFEESINDICNTKKKIADFLGISVDAFPAGAGNRQVNYSYVPKMKWLNNYAAQLNRKLTEKDLDWAINLSKSIGAKKLLQLGSQKIPALDRENREKLDNLFAPDIANLEKLLNINLDVWRTSSF